MPKKPHIKRVLFLQSFPLFGCGSGTYTKDLAYELDKMKDIETAIVCPQGKEEISGLKIYPLDLPFPVAFTGHPEWPGCRLYRDLNPQEIAEVFKYFLSSVVRAVEDFKPNLIHCQHISLLVWVASFIKLLYGINFIVTAHGTGVLGASESKVYIIPSQDALKRAKKIVAVSGDTKRWLLKVFGIDFSRKTRIIPGGIHWDQKAEEKPIKIINEKYNLEGKKVVLFSGKLVETKGVNYLIKAARDIPANIFIIGDGPEKKNLEDLVVKMGLSNVHLLGYMGEDKKEELAEFYRRADVFVAPSVWDEPLGLVILEAMAAGTPVVATRKGGIPLAVKDGVNGILIRPRNSQQIVNATRKILENDELRKKMGEAARKTVEEKFTWEKIAQKYLRIYNKAYANGNSNGNGGVKKKVKKKRPKKRKSRKLIKFLITN